MLAMRKRANRHRRIVQLVVGVVVVGPQAQQRNGVDAEMLSLVGALDTTVDIVSVRQLVQREGFVKPPLLGSLYVTLGATSFV